MSNDNIGGVDPSSSNARKTAMQQAQRLKNEQALEARITIVKKLSEEFAEQGEFMNFNLLRNAETLEKRIKRSDHRETGSTEEEDPEMQHIDGVSKTADEFENKNPEMQKRALLSMRQSIDPHDSPEEILRKILKSYPDHYLADEALDFLCQTSDSSTKIGANLRRARNLLNERFAREIRAGRNISTEAREFAKQGIGTPTALRDLYRDVTGNPREPLTLFEELNESFNFDKMKTVISFILHSIGSDLKSKGPSIDRAELQRLFSESRTMQTILGIYRFFFQRMRLIESSFHREDLTLPTRLTFELLAKQFVRLLQERYPSPDKVLRLANLLGISEEILAQIIIFTQFRDALRGVSPRLFRSDRHRQDLLMTLIETISELDDLLEEEDEEDDEEEEDDEDKKPGWSDKDSIE